MPYPVFPITEEKERPATLGTQLLREFGKWYKDAGYGTYSPTMADRANAKRMTDPKKKGGFGYPIGYALEMAQLFFYLRKTDPRYRKAPVTFGTLVFLRNDLIAQVIERENKKKTVLNEHEF